MCYLITDYL